jgi:hypothetical protein
MLQHYLGERKTTYMGFNREKHAKGGHYEAAASAAAEASSACAILCLRRSAISARLSAMSTDARTSH